MAQYNVGLPFLKTSFNPVSRQANRKTAKTAFINAVMREMFDERIGRDKDIEHSETANNEWLIANKTFTEIYENVDSGEIKTYEYTPDIDDPRALTSQQKLVQRDLYTADEYVKSVKKIVDDNNDRLKENSKRKLRKDCMCCVAGIVKVPMEIANQEGFDSSRFYRDSLEVLKELCNDKFRCGEINAAVIHRDEYIDKEQKLKSDHLHYNIIPYCWEEGKNGKFKSLNGKKFLNQTFFNIVNKNYPKMMRERGWEVADCTITEELDTKKEQKQHQEQAAGKDAIHYKAQAEREKERLLEQIKNQTKLIEQQKQTIDQQYSQISKMQKEILELKLEKQSLIDRIKELIDMIKPLERLKNLIHTIRKYADQFIEFEENIIKKFDISEQEYKILEDNADIINTTEDIDSLIDKINDIQKEIDQDNDQKFEMTR